MQTPKEDQVSQEVLNSLEYQVVQTSIEQLSSILLLIQEGIDEEIRQARSIHKMIEFQNQLLKDLLKNPVVSMDQVLKSKSDRRSLRQAAQRKSENIRHLNGYLNERMTQLKVLELKKQTIIEELSSNKIIKFRKTTDEQE